MSNSQTGEIQSGDTLIHVKVDTVDRNSPVVLFIPGVSGGALTSRFDYLAEGFNQAGFNFVRFNFRGQEEGKSVDDSTLQEELEDLRNVLVYLESQQFNLHHFGVVAKSFGSVKAFLLNDPRLDALGLLAPATYFSNESTIEQLMNTQYRDITHSQDLQIDEKILKNWEIPTVIVHGDQDKTVPLDNSQRMVDLMPARKELMVIPGAGHSLDETEKQREVVLQTLVDFFIKHLVSE